MLKNTRHNDLCAIAPRQNGMILIAGLILLLVITLIGVTSMQSVTLSEKMAANMRDSNVAFHATESALSDAEQWLQQQASQPAAVSACDAPPCAVWEHNVLGTMAGRTHSWWQAQAQPFSSNIAGIYSQPRYIIEEFGFVPNELSVDARAKGMGYHYYQVTARGTGGSDTTQVIIQSIYATQYN